MTDTIRDSGRGANTYANERCKDSYAVGNDEVSTVVLINVVGARMLDWNGLVGCTTFLVSVQ